MAKAELTHAQVAAAAAGKRMYGKPLEEGPVRTPIYVRAGTAAHLVTIFKELRDEFRAQGLEVSDGGLQTEPLEGYAVLGLFRLYLREGDKRHPEDFGMVTLYGKGQAPEVIGISPDNPESAQFFITALAAALERAVPASAGDVYVSVQNSPAPAK